MALLTKFWRVARRGPSPLPQNKKRDGKITSSKANTEASDANGPPSGQARERVVVPSRKLDQNEKRQLDGKKRRQLGTTFDLGFAISTRRKRAIDNYVSGWTFSVDFTDRPPQEPRAPCVFCF